MKKYNTNFKVGDLVEIVANTTEHKFDMNEVARIKRIGPNDYMAEKLDGSDYWYIDDNDAVLSTYVEKCGFNKPKGSIIKNNKINLKMKKSIKEAAEQLIKTNGSTTTLEIKTKLRTDLPFNYWTQSNISDVMSEYSNSGAFDFSDNGTYRTYSFPVVKKSITKKVVVTKKSVPTHVSGKITRKKALDLMKNNKGRFFTVTFVKQDGTNRVLNGQYVKGQNPSPAGYVLVKESGKLKTGQNPIRNVNLQTLKLLTIAGTTYKINK